MISEKELNSYRLTSMEEPTDEMLAQIMHEAAEIYREEHEDTKKKVINMIREASNQALINIKPYMANKTHKPAELPLVLPHTP